MIEVQTHSTALKKLSGVAWAKKWTEIFEKIYTRATLLS